MNLLKIIFVLLFTCLLVQNKTFSSNKLLIKNDSTYLKKLFVKGEKSYLKKDYLKAKKRLIEFISTPSPVNDTAQWKYPGYQYTRMKNKSCEYLKNIYFEEKDFRNALYYFGLEKGAYYLRVPRCGNDLFYENPNNANFISQCYEGLSEIDSALAVVSQYAGAALFNILNSRFVDLAVKKIGEDSLKSELVNALNDVYFVNDFFAIRLLGYHIRILYYPPLMISDHNLKDSLFIEGRDTIHFAVPKKVIPYTEEQIEEEKIKVKEAFKQSEFYKLIMEK